MNKLKIQFTLFTEKVYNLLGYMVNISLHGKLGKEFNNSWDLEVSTAGEALRALDCQIPGFRNYIVGKEAEGARYCVAVDGETLNNQEGFFCGLPKGTKKIDFLPVPAGGAPALPFLVEVFKMILVAVIVGAITAKIFEPPDPEELKESNSYLFAGPVNVEQQGIPVPIAYGTLLIGGKVVSALNRHYDRPERTVQGKWMPQEGELNRFEWADYGFFTSMPPTIRYNYNTIPFENDWVPPNKIEGLSLGFVSSAFDAGGAGAIGLVPEDTQRTVGLNSDQG
jgi:predicted phage tail protein